MRYSEAEILEGVRAAIGEALKIPVEEVGADSVLTEDLGMGSLDFVDIMFRLQSRFNVKFHPGNPLDYLSEVIPGEPLIERFALTERGAEVVRRRFPELAGSRITAGMPVANVQALYTPATWVRAVRELLEAQPDACPDCGSELREAGRLSVLLCPGCGRELECPAQPQLLDAWASREFGRETTGTVDARTTARDTAN